MFDTDVFIVGAGPAGLAAAIAARRQGLRVMLADTVQPPIDKACGEGLMPDSRAAADRIGLAIPASSGFLFGGIRFVAGVNSVAAPFPEGEGLGIRRTLLSSMMVAAAERAGVEMSWGTPATLESQGRVRLGATVVRARWIVGADGPQSGVRRWAALDTVRRESRRVAFRRHFRVAPWSRMMEIHWGDERQFYVTPVSENEICLVLIARDSRFRIDAALPTFPQLAERLSGADPSSEERGAPASTRRLHRVTRGCVALIGDASGTVDPITGEGLCLAFQQAESLAAAMASGSLANYEQEHHALARRPVFMADMMLTLDRWPAIRGRAVRAMSRRPNLFRDLLALHVGHVGFARIAASVAVLGWGIAIQ
ncbi:MAG: NAD(P)/FAD-dependent oxidoreductase [Bryobacteraceae bacterium]